ncbi:hypothetical protein CERSUDRAFT_112992 [Gelatoporia subvermispora B]|uniref:Uncharacterized protein n=1 Tax=Ceriporiopsis subvermispora (strain B) TaxID=914234 RepID=M2RKL3_CERS8|nr:hypothetical protein CERSUDRAFT_112992 [Gelatoporia subvermispora B]
MSILPRLDDDCALELINRLETPSLAALSQTSKTVFNAVGQHLVQNVSLTRDPNQVLSFCRFALSHNLAQQIRHLHVGSRTCDNTRLEYVPSATTHWSQQQAADTFAGALADVLERTTKLECLSICGGAEQLIESEPRIAIALVSNPPSVSLRLPDLGKNSLFALETMRAPPNLIVSTNLIVHDSASELESIQTKFLTFLATNADRLYSVDFDTSTYNLLAASHARRPLQFPKVEMITIPHFELSPRHCALIFPNVRYFRNSTNNFAQVPHEEQEMIWPKLVSAEGMARVVMLLARLHPSVRRLHLSTQYGQGGRSYFPEVCKVLRSRDILSLAMAVEIVDDSRAGTGPHSGQWLVAPHFKTEYLWIGLGEAIPQARFLSVYFRRPSSTYMTLEVLFAALKHEMISSLGALPELRYVSLRYIGLIARRDLDKVIIPTEVDISELWFDRIPSLEYLELDIKLWGWKRTWWRRLQSNGSADSGAHGTPGRIIQVSHEEGLSAREYFDWEGCR